MKAIAVIEHFFQDVSDVFLLISTFVLFDEKCIFVDSAPVKPKRDLEFSAKCMNLFDVLHADRLSTDVIVGHCKHYKVYILPSTFFKDEFSKLRDVRIPLKVIGSNFNRIGQATSHWKTEVSETESRLKEVSFRCIEQAITHDPFFLRGLNSESLKCIEK